MAGPKDSIVKLTKEQLQENLKAHGLPFTAGKKELQDRWRTHLAGPKDPMNIMRKKQLQELLKSHGLLFSGTKKEMRDRWRQQSSAVSQGKQDNE